jgi:YfiH family protein
MARLLFTSIEFGSLADPVDQATEQRLSKLIGKPIKFMKQTHSDQITILATQKDADQLNTAPAADGLVSNQSNIALAVRVADCLPLLLHSTTVVAAVHVGRKGLLNKVALNAVTQMRLLGAEQITGIVGPHICRNCYEVDSQMFTEITKTHPATAGKNKHLNLFAGLAKQLAGIELTNLGICTKENTSYYSHRRDGNLGRQVGVICL